MTDAYLPKTVAKMLVDRKAEIDELKDLFGDEYIDNDLVFCTSNGRPMESQIINRAFNKLIKENGFPHVVFHSLRHSSITYKFKLNGGDSLAVGTPGELAPAILEIRAIVEAVSAASGFMLRCAPGLFSLRSLRQLLISAEYLILLTHLPHLLPLHG